MFAPAVDASIPATKNEFVLLRRTIFKMVAFGTALGETAAVVFTVAFPVLAADALLAVSVRPEMATAAEMNMDERRRTQNSCGWSKVWTTRLKRDCRIVDQLSVLIDEKYKFPRRNSSPVPVQRLTH